MGAIELEGEREVSGSGIAEEVVSLGVLAELTGFPVDYIKRELLSDDDAITEMTMTELRKRVLSYLDSNY
jgi:hypothetical protein